MKGFLFGMIGFIVTVLFIVLTSCSIQRHAYVHHSHPIKNYDYRRQDRQQILEWQHYDLLNKEQ